MMRARVTGIEEVDRLLTEITPRHAKNLLRTTLTDVAKGIASDARDFAPRSAGGPSKGKHHFASTAVIKHKRDDTKMNSNKVSASVRVTGPWRTFWKMLERGTEDTPEFGMFMKAIEKMRPELRPRFLASFRKKLAAQIAREKKKAS